MENPFNLSEKNLKDLLSAYKNWLNNESNEARYPQESREKAEDIKKDFLDEKVLNSASDNDLYEKVYTYSRSLEGPAYIRLGEQRIKDNLDNLRRNFVYITESDDSPFDIAENILEGDYKIDVFAKAFWSPVLNARFPDILPNWNNKTENFMKKLGVNINTSRLTVLQKYELLSDAFKYLVSLSDGLDFSDINHLMHYGTVINEGVDLINNMLGIVKDPVRNLIEEYKKLVKNTQLEDELYKWELVKEYYGRPDINAENFAEEIKSIDFKNLVYYNANVVKDHIATKMPEEYRKCFRELYDESVDLEARIKKFMDDVLQIYRKLESTLGHHHDERTISIFLTYNNPEEYTFYKESYYKKYCHLIGVKPKSVGEKYAHYMDLVYDFRDRYIIQDKELLEMVNGFLTTDFYKDENHLLLAQDILYQMLDKTEDENHEEYETSTGKEEVANIHSLNTVLYGPPGTGKTYSLVDKVVEYIMPEKYGDHENNKVIYKQLENEGRVIFTTFHQSMSYEDFIEGIKPVTDEDNDLSYKIIDGVFKEISVNAAFEYVSDDATEASASLDFSTLYDKLLDEVNNQFDNDKKVYLKLKSGSDIEITEVTSGDNFHIKHKDGTRMYTVSRNRLEKLYTKLPELDEIENINEAFREIIGGSNSSAYWAVLSKLKSYEGDAKSLRDSKEFTYKEKVDAVKKLQLDDFRNKNVKKFALVIDEINRGNVSQIFGELITLIEEDKRYGGKEPVCTLLPYSRDRFFVPHNLFIIGTMNTADRSVEALDTALRRRFSFQEKMPEYKLKALDKEIAGFHMARLLKTINARIEKLIDRDHQIGHSYFIGVNSDRDLMQVFKDKVIPLLQEYFFGNYEKLGLVLGDGFVKTVKDNGGTFSGFAVEDTEIYGKQVYHLKGESTSDIDSFRSAIYIMMRENNLKK